MTGDCAVKQNGKSLERVDAVAVSILDCLEICPCAFIHNDNGVRSFIRQIAQSRCNGCHADRRCSDSGNAYMCRGCLCGCTHDLGDKLISGFLSDLVSQLIVDILKERLSAHVHNLIRDCDPFLDGRGHDLDCAENECLFCGGVCSLSVDNCAGRADFETDLQIAFEISFLYAGHDSLAIPCGFDDALDQFGNRNTSGCVLCEQCAALCSVAGLNIICICVDVFGALSDFQISHDFSFLRFGDFCACAIGNFRHVRLALFDLCGKNRFVFCECARLCLKCIKVCALCCYFDFDRGQSSLDFLQSHFFDFHRLDLLFYQR